VHAVLEKAYKHGLGDEAERVFAKQSLKLLPQARHLAREFWGRRRRSKGGTWTL
jgi:hypothetical protein